MSGPRRGYIGDEELGKKFDDDRARKSTQFKPRSGISSWKFPRRRRILLAFIGIFILYLLFKAIPPSNLTPATKPFHALNNGRPQPDDPDQQKSDGSSISSETPPEPPPDTTDKILRDGSRSYSGPIKFYSLAKSLYTVPGFEFLGRPKAVVFAAADLQALSDLLPLACEMARQKLNHVHFAVMGRNDVSVQGIRMVNGVDAEECPLLWHDARPDYAPQSTDARMESSVIAGLSRINNVFRPSVVITHSYKREEDFLWKGVKVKAGRMGLPHISLPARASNFMWLSKLDSGSLGAWNKVDLQILVQAPPASSGSLTRLLRSLQRADYFGDAPGLTIELPHNVDPPLLEHLKSFKWPPNSAHNHVTLRRRIQPGSITPQEATLRTVDSVYPKDPAYSHVLVLSAQADLAPSYYHYLKYAILKYKYSVSTEEPLRSLLGISLELPSAAPTVDDEPFTPPTESDRIDILQDPEKEIPVFLWQAPNSNAALYFGDKWVEFQSFLSNRLGAARGPDPKKHPNLISNKFPSWMEYMLELIRARGYYLLYPSFPATTTAHTVLATIHNDLYRLPEEYASDPQTSNPTFKKPEKTDDDHLVSGPDQLLIGGSSSMEAPPQEVDLGSIEKPLATSPSISTLLNLFPAGLPKEISPVHVLPYSRKDTSSPDLVERTQAYLKEFRERIGRCDAHAQQPQAVEDMKADDLFCSKDEERRGAE
ncbi:hypothetical protein RJZ56_002410 [Blastomyces dermatitidis]|uniref:Glycosyltransferase 2 n=2 Tax=Ajellomyces dermatitidis TaxID=5039 RepID=F2TN47_AJEDA|nr:uncharacterized protein BDCG_08117 [Blastomyces dermatitidis ER-3]EEQ84848.1 hypothetical protein BDCG_08117 [Blastomyces dermatitidis ER-3]EGE84660.1 hypothetical protein BDDG_07605 [Blastomyces dermatitidis ATCC 18188]EQL36847.1 hypothetical protein BDFG_01798 [Blastomyces dermatitidis ATCC 26199]